MNRGEVFWADLPNVGLYEQFGRRPAVVVQSPGFSNSTTIIIPLTTTIKDLPGRVFIRKGVGGLSKDSMALCHQIRVISNDRLYDQVGALPDAVMK